MDCCFDRASDSEIAFPKSKSFGWYILFTSVRIMLSPFISLWRNLCECKCSIASHSFSTMFPTEQCERDMDLLSRARYQVQEKQYCKDGKNITQGSTCKVFFVTFTPNRWGIDGWEHSVYKLHFCYLVKRKK